MTYFSCPKWLNQNCTYFLSGRSLAVSVIFSQGGTFFRHSNLEIFFKFPFSELFPALLTLYHGCQMAIATFLDCMRLAHLGLKDYGSAVRQNLIPFFPWIASPSPRPPPLRNPRKDNDQILPSGNLVSNSLIFQGRVHPTEGRHHAAENLEGGSRRLQPEIRGNGEKPFRGL